MAQRTQSCLRECAACNATSPLREARFHEVRMHRFTMVSAAFVAAMHYVGAGAQEPRPEADARTTGSTSGSRGLILQSDEGERLVRRQYGYSLVIKVDPRNGGSRQMIVGTEEVPPGKSIPLHKHPHADELLLIQQGSGIATLGSEHRAVDTGATIFIPENEWVGFTNTGDQTVRVFFVFSKPGFEEYLRATSTPEGQRLEPFTDKELAAIRERFKDHITFK
jgi:quercetin dioxygenase-like cupin family protein